MNEGTQKEIWWLDGEPPLEDPTEEEVRGKGSRISISHLETLTPLYEAQNEDLVGAKLLETVRSERGKLEMNDEHLLKNVKASIYGTQIHSLQYFTQLFDRCASLGRIPDLSDFYSTFPFKGYNYYYALTRILEIASEEYGEVTAENFWKAWRLNGHDFSPKQEGYKTISPNYIQQIWESRELEEKILKDFAKGRWDLKKELNPERKMVMNEGMLITNIDFGDRNMQLISIPDEVRIPNDWPNSPIEIIDYKTGYEFKKPDNVKLLQIFLTKIAVLNNVTKNLDEKMRFSLNAWEVVHDRVSLPGLVEKKLRKLNRSSLLEDDLRVIAKEIDRLVKFSYVSPSMLRRIHIEYGSKDGYETEIEYIKGLNEFYSKNKDLLLPIVRRRNPHYSLPSFPYEGFDYGGSGNCLQVQGVVQSSLF